MATRKQKAKVGVFLLTCFAIIIAGAMAIAGMYSNRGIHYSMEFEDSILGLGEGGLVEYLGVPVGKVSSIYVTANNKAHVDALIDPVKVTLHEGVEAQLVIYSFAAGTMAISLRGGNPKAPLLEPGGEIPAKPSAFATISSEMEDIMERLGQILEKLNTGLEGMEEGDIATIVDNVNDLLDDGRSFLDDTDQLVNEATATITSLRDEAEGTLASFGDLTEDVRNLSKDIQDLVQTTTDKLDQMDVGELQEKLNRVLENTAQLTEKLNQTAGQIDNLSANAMHEADNIEYTLRQSLEEVTEAFKSLQALTEAVKQDPASLLRGKAPAKELKDSQP
ncbi:MAG: MCE family protein [Candidatus Hydrogenedentes bacterium]|nr:MCE family protein [Candidatus Hydrogenedentota bacterium]